MLYLLTFVAGGLTVAAWTLFHDFRRASKFEAWERIREGTTGTRVRLSEVLRQQGVYDHPEV